MTFWLSWLPILAGIASAMQAATNSALTMRTNLGAALVVNAVGTLIAVLPLVWVQGWPAGSLRAGLPWPLFLGGLYGFTIISLLTIAFPRLGGAVAIALFVLGQGLTALSIDHFGLLGQPRDPMTMVRVAGIALVVAGVALLRWK